MFNKLLAEALGTFWLVFAGCGAAVISAILIVKGGPSAGSGEFQFGIGLTGIALAFGLSVMTMAYAIGHISGCHLNPAVSVGLCVAGRFKASELVPYIVAQVAGGLLGATVLWFIASGNSAFAIDPKAAGQFATNYYGSDAGELKGANYHIFACALVEVVMTFMFLIIILGATDGRAPAGFAPIAIGLGLTLIILVGGPVTNLSVNPARSTAPAVLVAGETMTPLRQLWLFWAAPVGGAVLGGLVYRVIGREEKKTA
jgi:aquaporin Z